MPRTSKQVQTRNTRELRPMFAPAHCSLLPRCRRHVCPRALQLAPHALPHAQYGQEHWPQLMGSWPHLYKQTAKTACMAPSTQSHHCSTVQCAVLCVRAALYVKRALQWGVVRRAFASDKTVKGLLHGRRQVYSLESELLLEGICRVHLLALPRQLWQGYT